MDKDDNYGGGSDLPPSYEDAKGSPSAPMLNVPRAGGGGGFARVGKVLSEIKAPHLLQKFRAEDMDDEALELLSGGSASDFARELERLGLSMGEALKFSRRWTGASGSGSRRSSRRSSRRNASPPEASSTLADVIKTELAAAVGSSSTSSIAPTPTESSTSSIAPTPAELRRLAERRRAEEQRVENKREVLFGSGLLKPRESWWPARFAWVKEFDSKKQNDDGTFAMIAYGDEVPRGCFSLGGTVSVGFFACGGLAIGVFALGGVSIGLVAVSQGLALGLILGIAQCLSVGSFTIAQLLGVSTINGFTQLGIGGGLFWRGNWGLFGRSPVLWVRNVNDTLRDDGSCGVVYNDSPTGGAIYSIIMYSLVFLLLLTWFMAIRQSWGEWWRMERDAGRDQVEKYPFSVHVLGCSVLYMFVALAGYIVLLVMRSSGALDVKGIMLDYFGCLD